MPDARTGAISRIATILRTLGDRPDGSTTTDLAAQIDLPRPTVHRLLSRLSVEGYVDRESRTGRWYLGPELYLLGSRAAARYDVTEPARIVVRRLARLTGESAFFSARRGPETVCLLREDGDHPLRSEVLQEGSRFPLGVVSAGLAVLSFLPDGELSDYLDHVDLSTSWGREHSAIALRRRIRTTRKNGYAVNPGLVAEGEWGIAAAVFRGPDDPAWALSLTGTVPRLSPAREAELGALLRREAHQLTQELIRSARPGAARSRPG